MNLNPEPTPSPDVRETVERGVESATDYVAISLRIAVVVLGAILLRWLLHRGIRKVVKRAVVTPTVPDSLRTRFGEPSTIANERRRQRTETVGSVLKSVATIVIVSVAFATVLSELGVNLGPAIAGAGIIGVALGFGAQNLVKDYLNGIFMILEDQYGVGDAIDVGEASGIVESVGLRTTRLRNVDGTVWHVRNGEIVRVGNMSQGWSRALLDVSVAYGTDVDLAQAVVKQVADDVWKGEEVGEFVLAEPEVWGVEMLGVDGIDIRLVVKTAPLEQWKVARELRRRLKAGFDEAGIEIPFPQRALWLRSAPDADVPAELGGPAQDDAPPTPRTPARSAPPPASAPESDSGLVRRAMKRPDAVTRTGEADVARSDTGVIARPGPVSPTGPADDGEPRP